MCNDTKLQNEKSEKRFKLNNWIFKQFKILIENCCRKTIFVYMDYIIDAYLDVF